MINLHRGIDSVAPPVYFLSYSRKDKDDVRHIALDVMMHGIEIWQDINHLGTGITEDNIRLAIREDTQGLLLYITEQSVSSEFIQRIELPEAEQRSRQKDGYTIVPIFDMPIREAAEALNDCLTHPISDFNGVKVNETGEFRDLFNAGHKAAELILQDVSFQGSSTVCVGISSKQRVSEDVDLNLDLMGFFDDGIPTEDFWDSHISDALKSVKRTLVKSGTNIITLHAFCHLSLGLLFGYIFRRTTGFKLEIVQIGDKQEAAWSTESDPDISPLDSRELEGTLESRNLCVTLNLMSSDLSSVTRYLDNAPLDYRAMLELSPERYPSTISGEQAVGIALDLASKIKDMHAKYDTDTVHLFCAIPLGLAFLIGFNMNACGTIRCYEFDNARRNYIPSCTLA